MSQHLQKKQLEIHAKNIIENFHKGLVLSNDPDPTDFGKYGINFFDMYSVRYTREFLLARDEFALLASKMLKSKSSHIKTLNSLCQIAGQKFVKANPNIVESEIISAARDLVETVLAEAGKEYVHIEPNYLIKHSVPSVLSLGRVRSMPTTELRNNTKLAENPKVKIAVDASGLMEFDSEGTITLSFPHNVWVVRVAATRENVVEEAKWLIDVAVSLMRLSANCWNDPFFPRTGEVESDPTYPSAKPQHITLDDTTVNAVGWKTPPHYRIEESIVTAIHAPVIQERAEDIFEAKDKSLGQRVGQGLGWMTRGRQASDRAERLLYFFTALEAILTSNDKNDPITQTISRYVSVILGREPASRSSIAGKLRYMYNLRSAVVHAGSREVLWHEVNELQNITENVFYKILNNCNLKMNQQDFLNGLADATHGLTCEFFDSAKIEPD